MAKFLFRIVCVMLMCGAIPASANPPLGYQLLCLQKPNVCEEHGAGKVPYSAQLLQTLIEVNASVNKSIRPVREAPGSDVWQVNVSSGDCEEFALAKRMKLIGLGLSGAAVRIAYNATYHGGHAVLLVNTTKGTYVLDILKPNVLPIGATPYGNWQVL